MMKDDAREVEAVIGRSLTPDEEHLLAIDPEAFWEAQDQQSVYDDDMWGGLGDGPV